MTASLDPNLFQDKSREVEFFDSHANQVSEYNVFTEESNRALIDHFMQATGVRPGDRVLDLGCGSGVFSQQLAGRGLKVTGLDLSPKLIERARRLYTHIEFLVGDAERLAFSNESFHAVFLGGVIHHFPLPLAMAREVARVTIPSGSFWAFDPNRRNPFMFLYRVKSSPFYSSRGVTQNEQPVRAEEVARVFGEAGFSVNTDFLSLNFTYVASAKTRFFLPLYNALDRLMFSPHGLKHRRAFVLNWGKKA